MLQQSKYCTFGLALLSAAWLAVQCGYQGALAEPTINQAALPLIVTDLKGQVFDLDKVRGKVVLVNFWATWCVPCRKEMPMLDAFYRRHRGQGLEVIAISIDRVSERDKVRKTMNALSYPVAMATEITDKSFGVPEGVPATFVVDANGVVRDKFIDIYDQLLTNVVIPLLPR